MRDFAHEMQWLVDEAYPETEVVRLVLDHLNTRWPASRYETFPPAEARRILQRLEFHYTPKHGSWLNMAEMELSVISREFLDCRIPDEGALKREIQALEAHRNSTRARVNWQFTSQDARGKLSHLYPSGSN